MELMKAIEERHSVRSYTDQKIEGETLAALQAAVAACNKESGLNIQLCTNEPTAFDSTMAHYGKFENVTDYIALVGKKGATLDETCGYYGEKLALEAQRLGLNTCWVAMSFSKAKAKNTLNIAAGEKLLMVLALGYGATAGVAHKSKPIEQLTKPATDTPEWFKQGVLAAQLAPTAINQQKFCFALNGKAVSATAGSGFYAKVDLGIAKYHFEIGAAGADWRWA